jgi:electron transport complex protein RnfG
MSDGADRRRRGRKLPIAPEQAGPAGANGLNGAEEPSGDGEAPREGEAEARPILPDVTDAPLPAADAEASADAEALAAAEAGATDGERPAEPEATAPGLSVKEVPSWRLILTLAAAGAMAGLAIVLVFGWAEPKIEAHRAEALRAAITEVLGGPERYETLYVVDGSLTTVLPANVDSTALDRIYAGYAADGSEMGFAIAGEQPGYQDIVGLIFGYDAESGQLLGMKVLESKETPGLGDKIEKDSAFVSSFRGVVPLIKGVKARTGTGSEHEVDMITGATISSRTVIEIINKRMESIGPMIQAYQAEPREAPAAVAAEAGG